MRVIVAGSRSFTEADYPLVREVCLASGYWYSEVISGGAHGVDLLGERFAAEIGVPVRRMLADWDRYGRGAGPRRNEAMAKQANALVAVWDGASRGTADMIRRARSTGLLVYVRVAHPK